MRASGFYYMLRGALFVLAAGPWCVTSTMADELRPAYIEVSERSADNWSLLFKAHKNSRLGRRGSLHIPANCTLVAPPDLKSIETEIYRSSSMNCQGSILGQRIGLQELAYSQTDALVRIVPLEQDTLVLRLTPDQPIVTIPSTDDAEVTQVGSTYLALGVEHILEGYDHLLFVISLVFLISGWKKLLWTVTAFTLAHSITLVGTTLGWFALPQKPVEAVIALSIVFVAREILCTNAEANTQQRLASRLPWLVALLFGLLHGFGFAGALAEIGLPKNELPLALFTFNLGVELGQLLIVAVVLALAALMKKISEHTWLRAKKLGAYCIGITSMGWLLERLF